MQPFFVCPYGQKKDAGGCAESCFLLIPTAFSFCRQVYIPARRSARRCPRQTYYMKSPENLYVMAGDINI